MMIIDHRKSWLISEGDRWHRNVKINIKVLEKIISKGISRESRFFMGYVSITDCMYKQLQDKLHSIE